MLHTGHAPAITRELEDLFIALGQKAEFTIEVNGTDPLSFAWYKDNNATPLNATGASLVINNTGPQHFGIYKVVISNPFGTAQSLPGLLSLGGSPAFTTKGPADINATAGSSITLNTTLTGSEPMTLICLYMTAGQCVEAVDERIPRARALLQQQLGALVSVEPGTPDEHEPVPVSIRVNLLARFGAKLVPHLVEIIQLFMVAHC